MRKHFLILMLLALLPLAGWAANPQLSVTLTGSGIGQSAGDADYEAFYKGSNYIPAITVTWDDGTNPASVITSGYSVSWEKVTSGTPATGTRESINSTLVKNAGYYVMTVTYTPTGFVQQTASASLEIKKIPVTLKADDKSKTYGEGNPAFTATPTYTAASAVEGESLDYTVGRAAATADVENAGIYDIMVTLTANSAVNANYAITTQTGSLTINQKQVKITAKAKTITYGNAVPTLTSSDYTVTGLVGEDANADLTQPGSVTGLTGGMSIAIDYQNSGLNSDMDAVSGKIKAGNYGIVVTIPTTGANCNYTFTKEDAALTVKQATLVVTVKDKAITYGDATPTSYDFVYTSGLMTQDEITEFVNNQTGVIANTVNNNIFDLANVEYVYSPTIANPATHGEYTVSVTAGTVTSTNYKVMINSGKLTVSPKAVPDAVVVATQYENPEYDPQNPGAASQYLNYKYVGGGAIEPTVTITNLTIEDDFTVEYKNNTKAFPATSLTNLSNDQKLFRKVNTAHATDPNQPEYLPLTDEEITWPYVIVTGTGNYSGTVKKAFSIEQAPLTIKADNQTITLGGQPVYTATITGLLESNAEEIKTALAGKEDPTTTIYDFTGKLTFSCLGGNNVGSFDISVGGLNATNYDIDWQTGTLTVNPGVLPLKVVITNNGEYGTKVTAANNFDFAFNEESAAAEGIADYVKNNVKQLVDHVVYTVKDGNGQTIAPDANGDWVLEVADNYTVSASAVSEDYSINFADATLIVAPKALTITIVNQDVDLFDAQGHKQDLYGDNGIVDLNARFYDAVNLPDEYDGTNAGYTIKVEGLVAGDNIESLNIDRLTATAETVGEHTNAIDLSFTSAGANPNYNYTKNLTKGKLTINGPTLEITRGAANSAKIADYAGATGVSVKVTRNIPATATEHWFTMVLPFNATLSELCEKWGYVVVNTLDKTNDNESKVVFKLQMQGITANEPFLIKFSQAVAAPVTFTNRTIADADYTQTPVVEDNAGTNHNKFIGSYDNLIVEASDYNWIIDTMKDKFVRNTSASNVQSIYAYLHTAEVLSSFAPSIYIQDENGNVTAINSIATDAPAMSGEGWYTINGVKLQGAPTEKGVYIQNGKKVILK